MGDIYLGGYSGRDDRMGADPGRINEVVGRVIDVVESRITLAASLLVLGIVAGPPLLSWWNLDTRHPIEAMHKVETLNSPVEAGGLVLVRIWRDKVRDDCPVTSERHALSTDGRIYDVANATHPGGEANTEFVDIAYALPSNIPPGIYDLNVTLTFDCPGDLEFTTAQPPARFRVAE